jgi:hypothetical protein
MKTFAQFISEASRDYYHDWGIIHPSGKVISGLANPDFRYHSDLKQHVAATRSAADKAKHPMSHFADYFDEKGAGLTFRTHDNKHSVGAAMKGLKKLPSSTGVYHHSHETTWSKKSGPEAMVRKHMADLHQKMPAKEHSASA